MPSEAFLVGLSIVVVASTVVVSAARAALLGRWSAFPLVFRHRQVVASPHQPVAAFLRQEAGFQQVVAPLLRNRSSLVAASTVVVSADWAALLVRWLAYPLVFRHHQVVASPQQGVAAFLRQEAGFHQVAAPLSRNPSSRVAASTAVASTMSSLEPPSHMAAAFFPPAGLYR